MTDNSYYGRQDGNGRLSKLWEFDGMPGTFSGYKTKRLLAEMQWRDRTWLNGGGCPAPSYESIELEMEVARKRPHENRTADKLSKHGIACEFVVDEHPYFDSTIGRFRIAGYADFADGTEIKTLRGASTSNTIDGHIRNASRKRNAKRLILDNSENAESLDDTRLIEMVLASRRFKGKPIYVLGEADNLMRIK